jgi:hypothetical protein
MSSFSFTVDPLWVSSKEHLSEFKTIFDSNSWYKKYFGGLNVPEDFPCLQVQRNFYPLVYFSSGIMDITGLNVQYTAQKKSGKFGSSYCNVDNSLEFAFKIRDITSLVRFRPDPVLIKQYTVNWIDLGINGFDKSILVCVGGAGLSMKRIERDTDDLFVKLSTLKAAS